MSTRYQRVAAPTLVEGTIVSAISIRFLRTVLPVALLGLVACTSGSTEVTGGEPTGATAVEPTGPTAATGSTSAVGPSAATGPTGVAEGSIAGTWDGTWTSGEFENSGSFSMTFEPTGDGFAGTIQINGSSCVSDGEVTAAVEGDRITIGAVQAEERIDFEGRVSGDTMSGTYSSPAACGNDSGTWEATLVG